MIVIVELSVLKLFNETDEGWHDLLFCFQMKAFMENLLKMELFEVLESGHICFIFLFSVDKNK